MKIAPNLSQTYQRRHWLLASSILENVFFSAVLLGWPAMVSVLKLEGYYAHLCTGSGSSSASVVSLTSNSSTWLKLPGVLSPLTWTETPPQPLVDQHILIPHTSPGCCLQDFYGCPAQEKKLNLCFTVGSFLLSAFTLPIGFAMDKCGSKWLRLLGGLLVAVSYILFASSSPRSPDILFFACALCGIGGNIVSITSLQVSNLFGPSRTLALGLLIGSYAAAAITFPTLKVLYALGVSLQLLFFCLAALTIALMVNTWTNLPNAPIPLNMDFTRLIDVKAEVHKGRESTKDSGDEYPELQSPQSEILVRPSEPAEDAVVLALHRVVFMPLYMWSIIVISIIQLRLLFFVGDLHQLLVQMTRDNPETVDLYIFIFGILQICCLGTTHFIGGFVDWRSKRAIGLEEDTHLLTQPPAVVGVRPTKPIPPSSTTTSLVQDKTRGFETVPPSPLMGLPRDSGTHKTLVPVHSTSLPVSPDVAASCQKAAESGLSASNSETFFNVRKSSLVHLVNCSSEPTTRKPSLTNVVQLTPEKRKLAKHNTVVTSSAVHSGSKELEIKIRKLKDCAVIFFVTSTLTVIFGLLVLIPSLTIQISTFVCYTLIRGFVPCAIGRLYSIAFRSVHHQNLIGLAFLLSALFSVVQHPLFVLVADYLRGDPYWVNVGLLLLSLLCFGLPIHILLHCSHLEEWKKSISGPPQPVIIKMQYVDSKLIGCNTPTEL